MVNIFLVIYHVLVFLPRKENIVSTQPSTLQNQASWVKSMLVLWLVWSVLCETGKSVVLKMDDRQNRLFGKLIIAKNGCFEKKTNRNKLVVLKTRRLQTLHTSNCWWHMVAV